MQPSLTNNDTLAAFQTACKEGDLDRVRELLAVGGEARVDVHAFGSTCLRTACVRGHEAVVRELLSLTGDRRLDVHAGNEHAFRLACAQGHIGIVRLLLSLEGDRRIDVHTDGSGAFLLACRSGHVGVVRELLALTGDRRIAARAAGGPGEALRLACIHGHLEVLRELLALTGDRRLDVHADGGSVFECACGEGQVHIVRELLALTGDREIDVGAADEAAFCGACHDGHLDVVRELLRLQGDRRVDVHVGDEEPLQLACLEGHVDILRELLALTGGRGFTWDTPQQRQALNDILRHGFWGRPHVVRVLLQHAPLPAGWLDLVYAAEGDAGDGGDEALQASIPQAETSIAQQVLLYALSGGGAGAMESEEARQPAVRALMLCAVLPGLRDLGLWESLTDPAVEIPTAAEVQQHAKDVAWRGVAVPIVPAPGADGLRGREGGLRRAARRVMVLWRTAAQRPSYLVIHLSTYHLKQ